MDLTKKKTERLVLLVLAAVQFTSIVDFMVVMPLGPQLMRKLNIGTSDFGLIVSSYTFAAGIAGLIASAFIDRFARRTTFLTFYTGFLIGTLMCGLSSTFTTLLVARTFTGAFGGILGGLAMAIIGDVFPEERRGQATGSLMSAFALASVAGVPLGLYFGTKFGWQFPFIGLAIFGSPILALAVFALPAMNSHIGRVHSHPIKSLVETFCNANHLNAFALILFLMMGGFAVIPFIGPYLVANVGMAEEQLPIVYVAGGVFTLIAAPIIGKLADRHGKLLIYRIIAPVSACLLVVISSLPPVPMIVAVLIVGLLMVSNAGRMIAAMAMATSSVRRANRGAFMSANSSVQHIASGIGAYWGGTVIQKSDSGRLLHFEVVGWIACAFTLITIWLAGRVKPAEEPPVANAITLGQLK